MLHESDGSQERKAYASSYEQMARDDLERPIVENRERYHESFLSFLGNLQGKKVLDIGSSNALYLRRIQCDFKAAIDISLPYLQAIPEKAVDLRIWGDAEKVRFVPAFFDVIIMADILEHLLDPHRALENVYEFMGKQTRLVVHVPWEEDIHIYQDSPYEYAHLRSFNEYSFSALTRKFAVRRTKFSYPKLEMPIFFTITQKLPRLLANFVRWLYFHAPVAEKEALWRDRWNRELPRREWILLRLYPPTFRSYELVPRGRGLAAKLWSWLFLWMRRPLARWRSRTAHESEA
jgi:SAM-dependent methyltransferase